MKSVATSPAIRALKFETASTNTGTATSTINNTITNSQQQQQQRNSGHFQQQHSIHHQSPPTTLNISSNRHQPTIIVTTTTSTPAGSSSTGSGYSLCNKADGTSSGSSMLSYPTIQIKQEAADSMDGTLEQTGEAVICL